MDRETFLDLIPAYALDALEESDRAEFEALLAQDAEAQQLLAEYQVITDNLVLTVPAQAAPAHLGADLRQRLATARPQPAQPKRPIWRIWLAAAAILAVVFGVTWGLTQVLPGSEGAVATSEQVYNDIVALDNVVRVAVTPSEDFTDIAGELVVDLADNRAVIQVMNLPPIEADQTFQLWLRDTEGTVFDGGLFVGAPYGTATYVSLPLAAPFANYVGFGVSLEPAGGSPLGNQRSGPSVFRIPLADT